MKQLIKNSGVKSLTPVQATIASSIRLNNSSLTESTTSDIEVFRSLLTDVISRTENMTVLPLISSYIPSTVPSGKIPAVLIQYTGKDEAASYVILVLADATNFVVDGFISSSGGIKGTIAYKEGNYVLVKMLNGVFVDGAGVDNVEVFVSAKTTISEVRPSLAGDETLFRNYSGNYTTAQGEVLLNSTKNKFKANIKFVDFDTKTKVIHTGFTLEAIQDILSVYEDGYDKILSAFSSVIVQEVEQDYIEWLRSISTTQSVIDLTASLGMQSGIRDIYTDILGRVNMTIGKIRAQTAIDGKWFVIGSYKVMQALRTIDLVSNTKTDLANSKYAGSHITGNFNMIEDTYAQDDYALVGHAGVTGYQNGSAIFIPYNIDIVQVLNPETLQEEVGIKIRYTYKKSPMDLKTTGSSMIESFTITGFDALPNF